MYKFWYDYIKPTYKDRTKLCCTGTDSFIIHSITEDFFEDIVGDVNKWFDTSNFDENDKRPLPIGMNKKVYGFFKDESGGKIMKEFVALEEKHMHTERMMTMKRNKLKEQISVEQNASLCLKMIKIAC